jgi:hypothetical protein
MASRYLLLRFGEMPFTRRIGRHYFLYFGGLVQHANQTVVPRVSSMPYAFANRLRAAQCAHCSRSWCAIAALAFGFNMGFLVWCRPTPPGFPNQW